MKNTLCPVNPLCCQVHPSKGNWTIQLTARNPLHPANHQSPSKSKQRRLQQPGKSQPKVSSSCKPRKSNKNKAARRAQATKALDKAREAKRKKYLDKIKLAQLLEEKDKKDSELKQKFNCSDLSIDLEKCDDTLDARKAKPIELMEKDPILDHVACEQPDQVDLLTENDKSKGLSKISETEHETSDGKLKCTGYGLKKPKKQEKKLKCPDTDCDQIFPYVKNLNDHMKEVHPDMKFKCQHCPHMCETHNACYKNEHTHFQLPYCYFCTKCFLFPGLRDCHDGQHTGANLLPCTWSGCKQQLRSKDALQQHVDTNTDERHPCEQCDKTFNTIPNLKQHIKEPMVMDSYCYVEPVLIGQTHIMNTKKIVLIVKKLKN